MPPSRQELCDFTLRAAYYQLRRDHPEAALLIADWLLEESPQDWVAANASEYESKIDFIKSVRAKFGLPLKEAKNLVDAAQRKT